MSFEAGFIELRVEVAGAVQVHRALEGVMARVQDLTPALDAIANHFEAHMEEVFRTQGAATRSGRWAPLREAYRAWKARHYPGQGILSRVEALRKSLAGKGPGAVRKVSATELVMGTALTTPNGRWNLGMLHQEGYTVKLRDGSELKIPARPIIDIPGELAERWMRQIQEHVTGGWDA